MTYSIVETNVIEDNRGTTLDHEEIEEFATLEEARAEFAELSKEKAIKLYANHKETYLRIVEKEIKPYNERRNEHYTEWATIEKTVLSF